MGNKKLLILRYLTISFIIFESSISDLSVLNFFAIILILFFIINTQIRYFFIRGRNVPIFISIIFDWIIGSIFYIYYGGLILPYFIIGIVDSFFLLEGPIVYISSIIGLLTLLYSGRDLSTIDLLSNTFIIISLGLISLIAKESEDKKTKAENSYHKLRKSADELIHSNEELEVYANSIKELSILKERNRISREIHDSVGHSLSTIIIQLGAIEKIAKRDGETAATMANNLHKFAKDGLEEIRRALQELKPDRYKEYETLIAIETLTRDFSKLTNIDVKLGFSKVKHPLQEEMSLVLYRIVQEFLSNSGKHSDANKINIFMHFSDEDLIVTMKDNGKGTNKINMGMGLTSICERTNELGGKIRFESSTGKGFLLRVVFPINKAGSLSY